VSNPCCGLETRHVPPKPRAPRVPRRCPTQTVGVDLSSQDKDTVICRIEWRNHDPARRRGRVVGFAGAVGDHTLHALVFEEHVTRIGIDAPFGWPDEFVSALTLYRERLAWLDWPAAMPLLALRETDRHVWAVTARRPLAVAADRIAYTAMRCASVLARASSSGAVVDRSGLRGKLVEVYPAAALRAWDLHPRASYKGSGSARVVARAELVDEVVDRLAGTVNVGGDAIAACKRSDHHLDALVGALVARAAELGKTRQPSRRQRTQAEHEGWIHLPECALADLTG
jgi:Protein of unknown function (DUF429)